jgi:two-component system response regulator DesR
LDLERTIKVVADVASGAEAVRCTLDLAPDVAVLDLEMPQLDGLEAARQILLRRPEQAIVLLTRHARPGVLRRALKAGIRGFAVKSIDPSQLAGIISDVASGMRYVDPALSAAAMLDDCPLSNREIEVLNLTLKGLTVREMAKLTFLASGTVRNYLSSAISKTGTTSRLAAARAARARGWL